MIECDNQYKVKYYIKEDMTNKFNGGIIIIRYDFLELVNKYSEYSYIDKEKEDIIDQITTYEDYIIVPKGRIRPFRAKTSKISDIIITDSKYLIEKDNIWTEFNRINPLLYFLEINCGNYDYDYKKIIEDIRIKCLNKDNKGDCLKYHEYFITSNDKYYIFNSKKLKFIKYNSITRILTDELLNNNFFESANRSVYKQYDTNETDFNEEIDHFNTLDINKIKNIFTSLIDDNILQDYKKLCYNIFVKQKEDIIFYDYSEDNYVLSEWLLNIMKIMFPDCVYEYNENYIENIKLKIPRMIIIDSNNISESKLNDIITQIKNIGIKNIIIKNSTKNMYKSKIEYNKYDLYYTYFKWCCTK
jgi:hypothetical protein